MTGGEGGGPLAVIFARLLGALGIGNDWHTLVSPEKDEPVASFAARAILRHPAILRVTEFGQLAPMTALARVRPTDMTLPNWERGVVKDEAIHCAITNSVLFVFDHDDAGHSAASVLKRYRDRIIQRLWVEFFAEVADDHLLMWGRFANDPEYHKRPVSRDLLLNPAMWLDPAGGRFWPMRPDRAGNGPDIGDLTVDTRASAGAMEGGPTSPPGPPASPDPRPLPTDRAVREWMRERVAGWPDDKPAPSEAEDFDAVTAHFAPGLSRDDFRLVRKTETPAEWRNKGPRRPWGDVKSRRSNPQ